jgi:hypothetical protein
MGGIIVILCRKHQKGGTYSHIKQDGCYLVEIVTGYDTSVF